MSMYPQALWLNPSPALANIHAPLTSYLRQYGSIGSWNYTQTLDEPSCLETALTLLHSYLAESSHPIHLLGHGTGGLLGWLYACRYPKHIRSLTLLGVGRFPTLDWQCLYYRLRQLLPCNREILLAHMVKLLFGPQPWQVARQLVKILDQDLTESLSPHSLFAPTQMPASDPLAVPMLVCGGESDWVVHPTLMHDWESIFKPGDRLWICPQGCHFFHYFFPEAVGDQILGFWQQHYTQSWAA